MGEVCHGPSDTTLWLNRKVGPYESQMLGTAGDRPNVTINLLTQLDAAHIDVDLFKAAVDAFIFNEPNFRSSVREDQDGTYWCPATDYSDVFHFLDQNGEESTGYSGCWELAEKLVNNPGILAPGRPMFKIYLVKRPDCYILMDLQSHVIGDGTTSFLVLDGILSQYDNLVSGRGVQRNPKKPLPSLEQLLPEVKEEDLATVQDMVEAHAHHLQTQQFLFPMNEEEIAASSTNHTLHAVGSSAGLSQLYARCKKEGVTIGEFSFAAMFIAEAVAYVRVNFGGKIPESGMPEQHQHYVGNLRSHLSPALRDECLLIIFELALSVKLEVDMTVWEVARVIKHQIQHLTSRNEHLLYHAKRKAFETDKYASLAATVPGHKLVPATLSSKGRYKFRTEFSWGKVRSIHSLGAYYCPVVANLVLLYHSVGGVMCYTMVHCDGQQHREAAKRVFDGFVELMENCEKVAKWAELL